MSLRSAHADARVIGIDVARCLALLGMMATHILAPVDADGGLAWPQALAGGRASALFAVLAGVSLSLMTGRREPHAGVTRLGDAAGLTARVLVIGMVGLWLGQLETRVAVILVYYSVLFLLGLPFLGQRAGTLFALSAWWCVAAPMASHVIRSAWGQRSPTVPTMQSLDSLVTSAMDLLFTGYYPAVPWLTYLLAGMAIGRLDLTRPVMAARALVVGAALAVTSWAASLVLTSRASVQQALVESTAGAADWDSVAHRISFGMGGTTPTDTWWWLAVMAPHSGTPFDLAHTTGTALAAIGAALLVTRWAPRVWAVAFGAGAMTLTLYTLHVALLTPERWPDSTVANYARHALLALAVGASFALAGRRGPLEAVARLASRLSRRLVTDGSSATRTVSPTDRRAP